MQRFTDLGTCATLWCCTAEQYALRRVVKNVTLDQMLLITATMQFPEPDLVKFSWRITGLSNFSMGVYHPPSSATLAHQFKAGHIKL